MVYENKVCTIVNLDRILNQVRRENKQSEKLLTNRKQFNRFSCITDISNYLYV